MRDFPSCFGENAIQVTESSSSSSSRIAQNLVTCVYRCQLRNFSCFISVTWTKSLMGQGLTIGIDDSDDQSLCKVEIKPWLFSKRKGSKTLEVNTSTIDIYWDLSGAKFGSGPEPLEGFYLGIVFNRETILLLGDLEKQAHKKINPVLVPSNAVFIAKRAHVFGKKSHNAKSQFCNNGQVHDITIECDTLGVNDPSLVITIDGKVVIRVKRLRWKFRGNHTVLVDGLPVEVCWDVHNWLFGNIMGNAVFLFQACGSDEKLWGPPSASDTSVLDMSFSQSRSARFSLVLYAWKNE